jgi:hypothetical protein
MTASGLRVKGPLTSSQALDLSREHLREEWARGWLLWILKRPAQMYDMSGDLQIKQMYIT